MDSLCDRCIPATIRSDVRQTDVYQLGKVRPNARRHIFCRLAEHASQRWIPESDKQLSSSSCPEVWVIPLGIHDSHCESSDPIWSRRCGHAGCQRRRESLRRYRTFYDYDGQYGESSCQRPTTTFPMEMCQTHLILPPHNSSAYCSKI